MLRLRTRITALVALALTVALAAFCDSGPIH